MLSTARHILGSQGAGALFHGLLPRAFRNCGAVIILNTTMTELVGAIDDHRLRQARQAAAAQVLEARAGQEGAAPATDAADAPPLRPRTGLPGALTATCQPAREPTNVASRRE